jgi:hypothetical protein
MALLVGPLIVAGRVFAGGQAGDDGFGTSVCEPLTQLCAVVGLVPEQLFRRLGSADEAFRYRAIVRLAAGQEDGKKTAFSICECMDLRIAPAS